MHVTVIAPDRAVFEGDADSIVVPAFDGLVGILPHHAPLITLLGDGELAVRHGGSTHVIHVRGGFLQVIRESVRVVAEYAQTKE